MVATDDVLVTAPGVGEGSVVALPSSGEVIPDQRGGGRWMRVTWHDEAGVVVLSIWRMAACVATLRLTREQVPALLSALVSGLATAPETRATG
jgi:hypothetical protein